MKVGFIGLGTMGASMASNLQKAQVKLVVHDINKASAKQHLADVGYDPQFGARPLKRTIQQDVQDPLALKILSGEFNEGAVIQVDVEDGELAFHQRKPAMA